VRTGSGTRRRSHVLRPHGRAPSVQEAMQMNVSVSVMSSQRIHDSQDGTLTPPPPCISCLHVVA